MFNLLISGNPESWSGESYNLEISGFCEHRDDKLAIRYKDLDETVLKELESIPALFAIEGDSVESRIGYIHKVQSRGTAVRIKYEFDKAFKSYP